MLHEKHSSKGTAPKVSKGRPESPLGSEAFVASGDKEKAERVSRNERPLAATIEAADAARRRETFTLGIAIVLSENNIRRTHANNRLLNDRKFLSRKFRLSIDAGCERRYNSNTVRHPSVLAG